MTDFDPTTNRTPFGLLTTEERQALQSWPHGWEMFDRGDWMSCSDPLWNQYTVYRGKSGPVVETYFCNVYNPRCCFGFHDSYDDAVRMADTESIGIIRIEIVDEKLKAVRVVKEDEA